MTVTAQAAPTRAVRKTDDETLAEINLALAQLAGASATHEVIGSGIRDHKETFYFKPENETFAQGADKFAQAAADEQMTEPYVHTFVHRPWDVALAFNAVAKEVYNEKPVALKPMIHPMTGEKIYKSRMIKIPVSHKKSVSMPFGTVGFRPWKAEVTYGDSFDAKLGVVGVLSIECARKFHESARGLCMLVEQYLTEHSIYKGKPITADYEPVFLDPWSATDPEEIIWTRSTENALRGSFLNVIEFTQRAMDRGQRVHRSVLFKGRPGNGKSETLNIVAQIAEANGWTYVLSNGSGLSSALHQARMYAPSVIAIEDFDRIVNEADPKELAELLEELDGTTSKGHAIMLVATTNFVDDLNQRIRRRMAEEIEFGPFDSEAASRYLQVRLRNIAAKDMDYERVAAGMEGWDNAYISKVIEFASGIALAHEEPSLTTEDLLGATAAKLPVWLAYQDSLIRPEPNKLDAVLGDLLETAVRSVAVKELAVDDPRGQLPLVLKEK